MFAELFDLGSDKGVTFEVLGVHMVGGEIRLQSPDPKDEGEWFNLAASASDGYEWTFGDCDWIDFSVSDCRDLNFELFSWEKAKTYLIP